MSKEDLNKTIIDYLMPYDPVKIGLFGSRVRGDNKPGSDLDILITINKKISLLDFVQMHNELTAKLGIKVDLVTERSIKNSALKKYIFNDLKIIYEKR